MSEIPAAAVRRDIPHVGLFNRHADAVAEADRRAALTRLRYIVRWDGANRWWHITESTRSVREGGHE
jgi:hypothetical protein